MKDYEKTFEKFWRELVCNPDGTLDPDAVKRELGDYYDLLANVSLVYDHVTGGKISKPNTDPIYVKEAHDELCDQYYEEGRADECALWTQGE